MKKGLIITLSIVLILLLAGGIAACTVLGKLEKLHDKDVEIVRKPDIVAVPTPEAKVDETLEVVQETPEDIGEDYHVEITQEDEVEQKPIFEVVPIDENVINVIAVGQDTGLEWNRSTRSDSCMIISYNRQEKSVKVVSILRDTWTPIDGHGWNRINAAYSFGGIGLLTNTINDVYGLDIQNYAITGFDEFKDCIDKIGGLDLELTEKEANYLNSHCGTDFDEGMNHLDGAQALVHARNRRTGDGDFGRVLRQRNLALAAFKKIRESNDMANYVALMEFGLSNIRTNMEPKELITLGLEVLQAEDLKISYARLPIDGSWSYATKDGKAVLSVDFEKNREYLKEFLYGSEEK